MKRLALVRSLLLLLPLGGLAYYFIYTQLLHPAPFYLNFDPEIAYFFNALAASNGHPLYYIDHPGTPLEVLGGILVWLTAPFLRLGGLDLTRYHLLHPELLLTLLHAALTLFNLIAMVVTARVFLPARRWSSALLAPGLAALFFILNPMAIGYNISYSQNGFNFFGGSLLLTLLYREMRSAPQPRWRAILLFSFAAGLLTSVTVYFATWVFGVLLAFGLWALALRWGWLRLIRLAAASGLSALAGFVIATLPILFQYGRMLQWMKDLVIHQGFYGSGDVGMVPLNTLLLHILALLQQSRGFTYALLATLAVLALAYWLQKRRPAQNPAQRAFILAAFFQLILTALVVAKHPQLSYFLAAAAILIPLMGAALEWLDACLPLPAWAAGLCSVGILLLFGLGLQQNIQAHLSSTQVVLRDEAALSALLERTAAGMGIPRPQLRVIRSYGVYDPCQALLYGDEYNNYQYGRYLDGRCSHDGSFEILSGQVTYGDGAAPLAQSVWDVILLRRDNFEIFKSWPITGAYRVVNTGIGFQVGYDYGPVLMLVRQP